MQDWITLYSLPAAAAFLYMAYGILILRSLSYAEARASATIRFGVLLGLILHVLSLSRNLFNPEAPTFGFGVALSVIMLAAVSVVFIESFIHRITVQMGLTLLVAVPATLMPIVFPGTALHNTTIAFCVHLFAAILAYAFMAIAVVQAILLMKLQKQLKNHDIRDVQRGIISNVPNLMAMERILHRIVTCAFVSLTAVLVFGAAATQAVWGTYWHFDHKMALSFLSWVVYAALLIGRYFVGWGTKQSLRFFWAGTFFLIVAYLVYRMIGEVFLGT